MLSVSPVLQEPNRVVGTDQVYVYLAAPVELVFSCVVVEGRGGKGRGCRLWWREEGVERGGGCRAPHLAYLGIEGTELVPVRCRTSGLRSERRVHY